MSITKIKLAILISFLLFVCLAFSQSEIKSPVRILFVPLDDRPPCLQFTQKMALIGDVDLISPPNDLLGRFTTPGQSDKIIAWLQNQDLKSFDAAIISLDMLAYGGLVGSRTHSVNTEQALMRIDFLRGMRKKFPRLKIYAQSVIMRLAPTADGQNEAYRADLSKWAEISVKNDEKSKAETKQLAATIPRASLLNYKEARRRNLQVNLKAVEFIRSGVFDYLILSQDDAKPVGIHVTDRLKLQEETKRLGLSEKIAIQPGADEVSMLLLSRALNQFHKLAPKIKAFYSSDLVANRVMPFEDKPLKETVSFHIKATGSLEVQAETEADLFFYVFASRNDSGRAEHFADEIEKKIQDGKKVMIADIDPVGDVQGGDSTFTNKLIQRRLVPEFNSYASWNTAANTIGTTLPQGIIFNVAEKKLLSEKSTAARIWTAQNWFTFHRVVDDYYYHGLKRLQINKHFDQNKLSSKTLDDKKNAEVEALGTKLMLESFYEFSKLYLDRLPNSRQREINCQQPSDFTFKLPWNRTFEAEINFVFNCSTL